MIKPQSIGPGALGRWEAASPHGGGLPLLTFAKSIRSLCDELGRLVWVVDPPGTAAQYVYDALVSLFQMRCFTLVPAAAVDLTPEGADG